MAKSRKTTAQAERLRVVPLSERWSKMDQIVRDTVQINLDQKPKPQQWISKLNEQLLVLIQTTGVYNAGEMPKAEYTLRVGLNHVQKGRWPRSFESDDDIYDFCSENLATYGEDFLWRAEEVLYELAVKAAAEGNPSISEVDKYYLRDYTLERRRHVNEARIRPTRAPQEAEERPQARMPSRGHSDEPRRPLRDRRGYVPPLRANKVSLKAFVDASVRDDFNNLAKTLGVTTQVLLERLARSATERAKSDPKFLKALRKTVDDDATRAAESRDKTLSTVADTTLKHTLG